MDLQSRLFDLNDKMFLEEIIKQLKGLWKECDNSQKSELLFVVQVAYLTNCQDAIDMMYIGVQEFMKAVW